MSFDRGVLLVNLGTPDALNSSAVSRYLRQFLMDPHVIDIPFIARWPLVNLAIVPTRTKKSLEAYSKVWRRNGSPLMIESQELHKKVEGLLGPKTQTLLAMRYGNPSIEQALLTFEKSQVKNIKVVLLYPQYASSSTGTAIEEVERVKQAKKLSLTFDFFHTFYDESGFISSWKDVFNSHKFLLSSFDHFVMSFHGLPERHIKKLEKGAPFCLTDPNCCEKWQTEGKKNSPQCYRAQCFITAHLIAKELTIPKEKYTVTFQSRLGRTPWIQPFTDMVIPELAKKGYKRLAVFCPSFVADCLETLEEIRLRAAESFIEAGGEKLELVPSLNANEMWAKTVAGYCQ